MAWIGWYEFDGNEVVNVARTEAYAARQPWFKPVYRNDSLNRMLGDKRYTTPLLDDAPWVDPLEPASLDFYGFYPLDITGIEDSTRTSTPTESLMDGGLPGRLRNTSRTVVFSGLLLAATEAGAEYGMRWLREALSGGACGDSIGATGAGGTLCYLASEPEMDFTDTIPSVLPDLDGGYFLSDGTWYDAAWFGGDASPQVWEFDADGGSAFITGTDVYDGGTAYLTGSAHQFNYNPIVSDLALDGGGPGSLSDMTFDGGGPSTVVPLVETSTYPFNIPNAEPMDPTLCLPPFQRSMRRVLVNTGPTLVAKQFMGNGGAVWPVQFTAIAGVPFEVGAEVPVISGLLDPDVDIPWADGVEPEGGVLDMEGFIYNDDDCGVQTSEPVYDPAWPQVIPAPAPPNVPLANWTKPHNWLRRQFTVPKLYVPSWGQVVPKLQVHARGEALRSLRVRFYADPYEVGDISDDPCAFCGDLVFSYIPEDHSLIFDGAEQAVYLVSPGGLERRADNLVFAADGTPFEWPSLTCGFGYVVTLDLPQTQTAPVVDLSLFPRTAA